MPDKKWSCFRREHLSFYVFSTVALSITALGRTSMFGPLKPFLEKSLDLSSVTISTLYTLGALLGGIGVSGWGSWLYQRSTARRLLIQVFGLFAMIPIGFFFLITHSEPFLEYRWTMYGFLLVLLGGARWVAQGMIPMILRNVVASHCDPNERPVVGALHGTCLSLTCGAFVCLFGHIQKTVSWPTIWIVEACVMIGMTAATDVFFREVCRSDVKISRRTVVGLRDLLSRHDANVAVFIFATLVLAVQQLLATSVAFHMADFARETGVPFGRAFSFFLYISILGIALNPVASRLGQKYSLFTLFTLLTLSILGTVVGTRFLGTCGGLLFVVASAMSWSFNHVLGYILTPRLMESRYIPAGNAFVVGSCNLFSALGPCVFSIFRKYFGSFTTVTGCVGGLACAATCAMWVFARKIRRVES